MQRCGKDFAQLHIMQKSIDICAPAVRHKQSCSLTRKELRDEGLLTQKQRRQLHHQWIHKRHQLEPADAAQLKIMAAQLTEHQNAEFKLNKATTAGIGVQTIHNMVQTSICCKPPYAVCLFPQTMKFYAVCAALQVTPIARRTVIKIEHKQVANFLRNEAQDWRCSQMGRTDFII